ncbi:MAG: hypothetical protein WC414_04265, partial [Patescibacteria group bacterium]
CGLNGRGSQTQICVVGQWSEPSVCVDPDTCVDGSTETIACGLNGRGSQINTCVTGTMVDGICEDSDTCVDGSTETIACGLNGRGSQVNTCVTGTMVDGICEDDEVCVDSSIRVLTCGLNNRGSQTDTCVAGVWSNGICEDSDTCVDGSTETIACGLNGRGSQVNTCVTGTMVDGICEDSDTCVDGSTQELTCGLNNRGTQTQLCVEGTFSDPSTCIDPDTCVDGSTTKNDNGDYLLCQEGSLELIGCSVEDTCWSYAGSFGFVETIFDTGVSCVEDTDCENAVCEAAKCVRVFDHLGGENFGCLPSGVCGTCDDADADGICGGSAPETCETNADCLAGQVCTPQGVCINYPDPAVTCFPFRMVLPANTSTTFIYVWNQAGGLVGGAPQALPEAVEGSIVIDSTSFGGACAITVEYPGRWQSFLDETFPVGAPTGNCFYSFFVSSPLRKLNGNGALGCAQDALSLP